jgi:hypothetical protein
MQMPTASLVQVVYSSGSTFRDNQNGARHRWGADMLCFGLVQRGFIFILRHNQETLPANGIDRAICIVAMRKETMRGLGHGWPDFRLLSVRKR